MPLTAQTRRAAAAFAIPEREWFSLSQAAAVMGMCESYAEKLWDRGELLGHEHNAGRGHRVTKRVLRVSLLAHLLRTARYEPSMLVDQIARALRGLSTDLLEQLHSAIAHELSRRTST